MTKKIVVPPKLNIVNDGVFPIHVDQYGVPIEDKILNVPTVQGEGKLLGIPSLFVRTSVCNLRCAWRKDDGDGEICPVPNSSWKADKNMWDVDDLVMLVMNNIGNLKHIVITGGEPMLQPIPMTTFLQKLKEYNLHITVETNGTFCDKEMMEYVDFISIAPKLKSSVPWNENLRNTGYDYYEPKALRHANTRVRIRAINELIKSCDDFQLKFIVSDEFDIEEINDEFLKYIKNVKPTDVFLMTLRSYKGTMTENFAIEEAVKHGWRYTPRLYNNVEKKKI